MKLSAAVAALSLSAAMGVTLDFEDSPVGSFTTLQVGPFTISSDTNPAITGGQCAENGEWLPEIVQEGNGNKYVANPTGSDTGCVALKIVRTNGCPFSVTELDYNPVTAGTVFIATGRQSDFAPNDYGDARGPGTSGVFTTYPNNPLSIGIFTAILGPGGPGENVEALDNIDITLGPCELDDIIGGDSDDNDGPSPFGAGDPHFKSWSGKFFDFHGECDLKLVHTPNLEGKLGNSLDLHARTTIRFGYSYIETAALRIGEDVLEVSSWGEHALNGVEGALTEGGSLRNSPAGKLGDYPVFYNQESKKRTSFDIVINKHSNITIATHKDIVAVKVNHGTEFGDVSGLWGNVQGELFARDQSTAMTDMNEYGREWQVRDDEPMLFRSARHPQYPHQCIMPDMAEKEARRLGEGINEEAAKIACDHLKDNAHMFANCVYDVTATNDLEMASTGAF